MKFIAVSPGPRRIVGIAADVDDENVVPGATLTVYHPLDQEIGGGRLFVHTHSDPYALVTPITRIIRDLVRGSTRRTSRHSRRRPRRSSHSRSFERAGLRRLRGSRAGHCRHWRRRRARVFRQRRTREFGIRLALGAQPRNLLTSVIAARRTDGRGRHHRRRRIRLRPRAPRRAATSWTCACPISSR